MKHIGTYGERYVEITTGYQSEVGPVWRVEIDGDGGPERFVDLDEAKAWAEERIGVTLTWSATTST